MLSTSRGALIRSFILLVILLPSILSLVPPWTTFNPNKNKPFSSFPSSRWSPRNFSPPLYSAFTSPPTSTPISDIPPSERGIGVGIDLGTTNSCVAILRNGIPIIVPTKEGRRTIPSVVSFCGPSSEVLVGEEAIRRETKFPEETYRNVKRVIGTGGESAARNEGVVPNLTTVGSGLFERKQQQTKLTLDRQLKDAEECPAMLRKRGGETMLLAPEEVSAEVLKCLFRVAEDFVGTGEKVTRAVIGVPAYFNDKQKEATMKAAKLAGVERTRLLREPEAAALAYGIGKEQIGQANDDELVLVFDLGGGTFDVSVLEVGGGITEVVATSGNTMLGGSDFDAKIAEWFGGKLVEYGGKNWINEEEEIRDAMLRCAEAVRIYLSNNKVVNLAIPRDREGWLKLERARDVIVKEHFDDQEDNVNSSHVLCQFRRKTLEDLCYNEFQALLRPVREVAILSQALLPGDARPNAIEAALRMEEEDQLSYQNFYQEDEQAETSDNDQNILLQIKEQDFKSLQKEQQKGRKRARQVAAKEKHFQKEKRKADAMAKTSNKMNQVKVRDGIHGRPISQVVLVGGATRMPSIGRLLAAITGVIPKKTLNPDEAVALGCAVQVGILDGDEDLGGLQVLTPIQAAVMRALAEKRGFKVNT